MQSQTIDWKNYEEAAKAMAGNWRKFECFCWLGRNEVDEPEKWCIVYTSNRDSQLMGQSNAAAIAKVMDKFSDKFVRSERHNHWAVGYVDGYSIRVYTRHDKVSAAFKAWCDIGAALENYCVLDEDDYSDREYKASIENIMSEGHIERDEAQAVYSWLGNNGHNLESHDDQGAYPKEEEIEEALMSIRGEDMAADYKDDTAPLAFAE
jgi:hypothetical protein